MWKLLRLDRQRYLLLHNIYIIYTETHIYHLDELGEDLKMRFGYLENMRLAQWLVIPFDMKIDNKDKESRLEDELIEMHVDIEGIALLKR